MSGLNRASQSILVIFILGLGGFSTGFVIARLVPSKGERKVSKTFEVREFEMLVMPLLETRRDKIEYRISSPTSAQFWSHAERLERTEPNSRLQHVFEAIGYDFPSGTYVEVTPHSTFGGGYLRICHESAILERMERDLQLDRRGTRN